MEEKKECIFCKIISGEMEAEKISETENFILIKDAFPRSEGHSLIISKKHFHTFIDLPKVLYEELLEFTRISSLDLMKANKAKGFNLQNNNFSVAGQVVPHFHLHIIPRKENDSVNLDSRKDKLDN